MEKKNEVKQKKQREDDKMKRRKIGNKKDGKMKTM